MDRVVERRLARHRLVDRDSQGPDVRTRIDLGIAARLFRRQVLGASESRAIHGGTADAVARDLRDAEVHDFRGFDLGFVDGKKHVQGLEVAVDHALCVRRGQCVDDRDEHLDGYDGGQSSQAAILSPRLSPRRSSMTMNG